MELYNFTFHLKEIVKLHRLEMEAEISPGFQKKFFSRASQAKRSVHKI